MIELDIDAELKSEYQKNPDFYNSYLKTALKKAIAINNENSRLEMVKVITRAKAPVLNWKDLEKEIFKGGTN